MSDVYFLDASCEKKDGEEQPLNVPWEQAAIKCTTFPRGGKVSAQQSAPTNKYGGGIQYIGVFIRTSIIQREDSFNEICACQYFVGCLYLEVCWCGRRTVS